LISCVESVLVVEPLFSPPPEEHPASATAAAIVTAAAPILQRFDT
jgi:hypothetical protein